MHFDAEQARDSFQQPHSCDPSPILGSIAFRSSFIRNLLLNLDPYGGNYPDGMCPLLYNQVGQELAPELAVILRHLINPFATSGTLKYGILFSITKIKVVQ